MGRWTNHRQLVTRRLALCAARLPGEVAGWPGGWRLLLLSSLSSSSAVSEATDIWGVR